MCDIIITTAFCWSHVCRSVEPSVRSNLVIALGDLAFRFPNLLEPWTERIYGPLSDPDNGDPQQRFAASRSKLPLGTQMGCWHK